MRNWLGALNESPESEALSYQSSKIDRLTKRIEHIESYLREAEKFFVEVNAELKELKQTRKQNNG